jgi:Holliday junction DNA helicase RuvA
MIGSIRGRLLDLKPGACLVEAGGVGYACLVSLQTFSRLSDRPDEVFLWVHTHVREDALQLIGFATPVERDLFLRLIGISGIGPKVALQVLSRYPAEELTGAIASGDLAALVAIPGVGKKTAARIIIELKVPSRRRPPWDPPPSASTPRAP